LKFFANEIQVSNIGDLSDFRIMTPERKQRISSVLMKRQTNITVVLENVFDPHNISAVMRTCDAVGIQEIYILNTIIPRHKKWGAKSSSSASKWLTIHQFQDVDACFEALKKNYDKIYITHLAQNAVSLYDLNLAERVALVFGNEHSGVSDSLIARADGNFIIPQVGIIKSLNISVACAVSIYEAYRQKQLASHYDADTIAPDLQSLAEQWGLENED
jgi:tRNA (guanosine-2'-O-)-methyltransferase